MNHRAATHSRKRLVTGASNELFARMIWLVALAFTVFAILYLAGLWQYACDELAEVFRRAWDRLK